MPDSAFKELNTIQALPHLDILHYLLSESAGQHIAHCLDLNQVAVGKTLGEAAAKLDRLVKAHIELALGTGQLANLSTRAPNKYWDMFAKGRPVPIEPATLQIEIPESVQIIPLTASELPILAHAA
jgi:hypothetical protein